MQKEDGGAVSPMPPPALAFLRHLWYNIREGQKIPCKTPEGGTIMFDKTGESLHGFTVTRIRESGELGGRLVELTYEKTGTELCWVDNGAENKLFSVSFKTLPEDSTGVFHILEHSVLCGSAKYPVREPFVELLKSSMQTFLNAMTFADKTMYPVSSRNTQDFLNLTEVYLDAVFAPRAINDPNVFYQEGWHIEQEEDGTLSYKGVVFNEMKGALSGVDDLCEYEMMNLLYPDTLYGFNSGGDPAVIPTLTHAQFAEFYRRFYHPSNAKIFLDGDVPMEKTLAMIEEYLCKFEKSDNLPEIVMQVPKKCEKICTYELDKEEPIENKGYFCAGKIIGTWEDRVKMLAVRVLKDAVAGSNEAPLKRALLSAGLAQEMSVSVDDGIAQPYFQMTFKNVTDGKEGEILPLVRRTAEEIRKDGSYHTALEASVNRLEFQLLEPDEPQALERAINSMDSWLYGGDPMDHLVYHEDFVTLRAMLKDGSFDRLLEELFINVDDLSLLHLLPSYTRGEELRADEAKRLAEIRAQWTDQDLAENTKLNETLQTWQQTPDSPEQLATLPVLDLSEVSEHVSWTETEITEIDGVKLLYHPAACPGIVHIALYFRVTDLPFEELTAAAWGCSLMTRLATEHYSGRALEETLKHSVGRLAVTLEQFPQRDSMETTVPMIGVHCSVLREKLDTAIELIREVLFTTKFTEKDKIREIMIQRDERMKQMPVMGGHVLGLNCTLSRYTARDAFTDATTGFTAMKRLRSFTADFDAQYETFCKLMERIQSTSFTRARLTASVTSNEPADISALIAAFPQGEAVPENAAYAEKLPERMGYPIPAQIGFAVQGWNYRTAGYAYSPSMGVAAKLISLSYLWNVVRVQGGAYGTGFNIAKNGTIFTYSFRDPSPAASLTANCSMSDFIRTFCESGEPLDGYIISTVADYDPLRSPLEAGLNADTEWLCGRTREERDEDRRGMLKTTREDLLNICKMTDAFCEQGAVCVVASENLLENCKNLTVSRD